MGRHGEDEKSRRKKLKRRIAAKLALGSTCLVLTAIASVGRAPEVQASAKPETPVIQRLQAIRSKLQQQDAPAKHNLRSKKHTAQWYNWSNWPNWNNWNDWGNGWSNWYNY